MFCKVFLNFVQVNQNPAGKSSVIFFYGELFVCIRDVSQQDFPPQSLTHLGILKFSSLQYCLFLLRTPKLLVRILAYCKKKSSLFSNFVFL